MVSGMRNGFAARCLSNIPVADALVSPGPELPPDQPAPDAAGTQKATPGASSQSAAAPAASVSGAPDAPEGADAPKKNHLLIPFPSRRSSKTDKQSTSEKAEETVQEAPVRRGSKVSILRGRRDRSRASSKRSRRTQTQDVANAEKSQETTTPATPDTNGPSKPQQKKSSKLLAFLSCCASGDVDGDDAPLPAKKADRRPPTSNRLPTPDKAETQAGDSSATESRDPAYFENEKAGLTVSADQSQSQKDERSSKAPADVQGEGTSAAVARPEVPSSDSKERDDHVPSTQGAVTANGAIPEKTDAPPRQEEPTPMAEESAEVDATSKKAMEGENEGPSHEEEVQLPVKLPPPPPPPVPEAPPAVPEAEQHWLLPPALPHLQGRKCLVLDLDETLVHSSFKVSLAPPSPLLSSESHVHVI